MTITLNPPPLQVPGAFLQDKQQSSFFSGLLNTIYQLWTAVYGIRAKAKVKTTDNTPTAMLRIGVNNNRTVMLQAYIVARRTGGAAGVEGDSAFYVLTGAYKNVNGVLTGIGSADLIAGKDQAAWAVGFSTLGTDAIIIVTGEIANDITWEGAVSTYEVGA